MVTIAVDAPMDIGEFKIKSAKAGFLSNDDVIKEGDTVIIYLSYGVSYAIEVKHGSTLNMRYGALKHDYLIGKCYGSRVSATAGYVYVIRPNAEMWTRALHRRTQILYTPDCALILMLMDIKPGSIICESGTGSGSLSHSIAMAIAPTGHLYTHDIDDERVKHVEIELNKHGLGEVTTCINRDVLQDGFFVENTCDAVFLDLPAPWQAIEHAKRALNRSHGGRVVSFSPCIEQVQKACSALGCAGFVQIDTIELVPRKLKVCDLVMESLEDFNATRSEEKTENVKEIDAAEKSAKKRKLEDETNSSRSKNNLRYSLFPNPVAQPTHTGYITFATLLPE